MVLALLDWKTSSERSTGLVAEICNASKTRSRRYGPIRPPPARGMVLNDLPTPVEPVVYVRGNPGRPGRQVSRHFLQAVGNFGAKPFTHGSGRLELAQDIASPRNPLTARVIVNRVWMHHFGAGIVRTASDFGIRGTPPSHPELLDYLASRFMREGWSLKKLHRQILLSAVYQQASVLRPDQERKDPENKFLWRMNPTRLEFEPMRDSWLAVAGNLDFTIGGRGFDIQALGQSGRRSVYAFIDRQDLPQLFRTFDFASPDVSTAQRPQTTIPQQALFAMNSPFLVTQARALARLSQTRDTAARVRSLYRRIYCAGAIGRGDAVRSGVSRQRARSRVGRRAGRRLEVRLRHVRSAAAALREFHAFRQFKDQHWGEPHSPTPGWDGCI